MGTNKMLVTCLFLLLVSSTFAAPSPNLSNDKRCKVCMEVLKPIKKHLNNETDIKNFIFYAEHWCKLISNSFVETLCSTLVKSTMHIGFDIVDHYFHSKAICKKMKLC